MTHRLSSWLSRKSFKVSCAYLALPSLFINLHSPLFPLPLTRDFQKSIIFLLPKASRIIYLSQIKIFFFPALPFKDTLKPSQSQGLRNGEH